MRKKNICPHDAGLSKSMAKSWLQGALHEPILFFFMNHQKWLHKNESKT
jgi:hypothetical protein